MNSAYIQSIGGASGDMLLGALIDLGLSLDALQEGLAMLSIGGYQLSVAQDTRCEVRGTKFTVTHQAQRFSPEALSRIVDRSSLPPVVKNQAGRVLQNLWQAESAVHGDSRQDLELEELGTLDTLVDVVGFAYGLHCLGISDIYSAPLVLGAATPPRWAGGYSNPAPATLELAAMAQAPVAPELPMHRGAGELTTPTGAAIITSLARFERPALTVSGIGVGLGSKDPAEFPNVVRIWVGETAPEPAPEQALAQSQQGITLLETNLDDVTGEVLGYVQERLFALGALDVWHTPIQMKKNRPGALLSALLPQNLETAGVELILRETPTLGVRSRAVERYAARREVVELKTDLGLVQVKLKYLAGAIIAAAPEYEDCRRIALETGQSLLEVYRQVEAAARAEYLG